MRNDGERIGREARSLYEVICKCKNLITSRTKLFAYFTPRIIFLLYTCKGKVSQYIDVQKKKNPSSF